MFELGASLWVVALPCVFCGREGLIKGRVAVASHRACGVGIGVDVMVGAILEIGPDLSS